MAKSRTSILPYVLLSPAVLATVIVVFYPMVQAVITSLYNNILWKPRGVKFIGLDNYIAIWHDPVFWASLGRTAIWIGLTVPLQLLLGLVTALLLNQTFRWRGLARGFRFRPAAQGHPAGGGRQVGRQQRPLLQDADKASRQALHRASGAGREEREMTMATTLDEKIRSLSPARRRKVD